MCQMCDDPGLTPADMRAQVFAIIERAGWMVQYVEGEDESPPFAYTVGLTGKGHPELFVTEMAPAESAALLNHVARSVVDGDADAPGAIHTVAGRRYQVGLPTEDLPIYGAFEVYGRQARAQQVRQV